MTAEELIKKLRLEPHPEGGYFRETYRDPDIISADALPERYDKDKSISTSIYFLITRESFSSMHRLKTHEILHFYAGDPAVIFIIHPDGRAEKKILGIEISAGALPQVIVPRDTWFGIRVAEGGEYTLMGTTVAPGFDFDDFKQGDKKTVSDQFPEHADTITLFTRE